MKEIINGNFVYKDAEGYWRVESATGEWDGYELYDTRAEAVCAAWRPNEEDEDDRERD